MVTKGFKRTEIGEFPEDWFEVSLGEYGVKIGSGMTPRGGSAVYRDSGRPFVRSQNVGWGHLRLHDLAFIDDVTHRTFPATEIREGDVLLNITGASIGRCAIASSFLDGGNVNQHVCIIRTKPALSQNYLSYVLLSSIGQKQIESFQAGGNREGLNFGQIRSIRLPQPPTLDEQERIARALSDTDKLIASLEKLIIKKKDIKTATLQQLLTGKTRLPGFGEGKGYKQTELGKIPEDWSLSSYGEVFHFLRTASNSRSELSEDGDTLYIHYGDIHTQFHHHLDPKLASVPRISEELVKTANFVRDGDLLMADASEDYEGIGKSIEVVNVGSQKMVAGLHTFLLRDTKGVFAPGFKGYLHEIRSVKASLDRLATGLKVYGLSKSSLQQVLIPVPSYAEQEAITAVLSDIESELNCLEEKLGKVKLTKRGMMQELLTGRTRLVNAQAPESKLEEEPERLHGT